MRFDAIIFDLDGTLTDSAPGITRSARYALETMGKPVPEDAILRKFLGPPLADSFMRYCGMSKEEAIRATALYRERYLPVGCLENAVYPGVRRLLWTLKRQGIYLAVATGKPQGPSEKILAHFHLDGYFDKIVGPSERDLHADKAELIRKALPEKYENALMVGDRESDGIGARETGLAFAAALYGYGARDEFLPVAPEYLPESPDALRLALCPDFPAPKGYFISFEGMDGCGKTTQINLLTKRLSECGYRLTHTREPGGCRISEKIRELVLDPANPEMRPLTEALLYAASRAQHVREVIAPALIDGSIVLCDRFVDSSVAYQGGGRELGAEAVARMNAPSVEGCLPGATIYLRLSAEESHLRRANASSLDRIEREPSAFQNRVFNAFEEIARRNPDRVLPFDAGLPVEDLSKKIAESILSRLDGEADIA